MRASGLTVEISPSFSTCVKSFSKSTFLSLSFLIRSCRCSVFNWFFFSSFSSLFSCWSFFSMAFRCSLICLSMLVIFVLRVVGLWLFFLAVVGAEFYAVGGD